MQKRVYLIILAVVFSVVLFSGCTQPRQQTTPVAITVPVTPAAASDTIKIGATSLGNVLTDVNGMTLYYFASDVPAGATACGAGTCATN